MLMLDDLHMYKPMRNILKSPSFATRALTEVWYTASKTSDCFPAENRTFRQGAFVLKSLPQRTFVFILLAVRYNYGHEPTRIVSEGGVLASHRPLNNIFAALWWWRNILIIANVYKDLEAFRSGYRNSSVFIGRGDRIYAILLAGGFDAEAGRW